MIETSLRSVALLAVGLLAAGAGVAFALAGAAWAEGVLAGGLVVLAGLGLSAVLSGIWLQAPRSLGGGLARLGMALKLPLLGLAMLGLFARFPVVAVVSGATVLVVAITLQSALSLRAREV